MPSLTYSNSGAILAGLTDELFKIAQSDVVPEDRKQKLKRFLKNTAIMGAGAGAGVGAGMLIEKGVSALLGNRFKSMGTDAQRRFASALLGAAAAWQAASLQSVREERELASRA